MLLLILNWSKSKSLALIKSSQKFFLKSVSQKVLKNLIIVDVSDQLLKPAHFQKKAHWITFVQQWIIQKF